MYQVLPAKAPVIDLTLFRDRIYNFSALSAMIQSLALFAVNFLIIFYLQGVLGYDPLKAALMLIPLPILTSIMAPIGGNIAENSGGPHTLKYGVTTNHVMGVEIVLPDGNRRPLSLVRQEEHFAGSFRDTQAPGDYAVEVKVLQKGQEYGSSRGRFTVFQQDLELDNASADGTCELLARDYPEVKVVALPENRGFTGGNNAGIRAAQGEFIILLNNDTEVDPHWLEEISAAFERHPEAGLIASKMKLFDRRDTFHTAGDFYRLDGIPGNRGVWEIDRGQYDREEYTFSACGGSAAYRRSMLEQIGLLDEGLYTYFDDVDICLRARRAGWETWFEPASVVIHLEGRSTGIAGREMRPRPTYWFEARRRFYLKNYGALYTALADAAFILGFCSWRVRRRLQRRPDPDPPRLLLDFVRNSVFMTGFEVRAVENPAMREHSDK